MARRVRKANEDYQVDMAATLFVVFSIIWLMELAQSQFPPEESETRPLVVAMIFRVEFELLGKISQCNLLNIDKKHGAVSISDWYAGTSCKNVSVSILPMSTPDFRAGLSDLLHEAVTKDELKDHFGDILSFDASPISVVDQSALLDAIKRVRPAPASSQGSVFRVGALPIEVSLSLEVPGSSVTPVEKRLIPSAALPLKSKTPPQLWPLWNTSEGVAVVFLDKVLGKGCGQAIGTNYHNLVEVLVLFETSIPADIRMSDLTELKVKMPNSAASPSITGFVSSDNILTYQKVSDQFQDFFKYAFDEEPKKEHASKGKLLLKAGLFFSDTGEFFKYQEQTCPDHESCSIQLSPP